MQHFIHTHEKMVVNLVRTGIELDRKINAILKDFDITSHQYNILRILRGARPEPLSAGEIKERMIFENSDLTRLIDRMQLKGIVERKTCPGNRRKAEITITGKGLDLLDAIYPKLLEELGNFFEVDFSPNRLSSLEEALTTIQKRLRSAG